MKKAVHHISKSNIDGSSSDEAEFPLMINQNLARTEEVENFILTDLRVKNSIITHEMGISEKKLYDDLGLNEVSAH